MLLTGESVPDHPVDADVLPTGVFVVEGEALPRVMATGAHTRLAEIARLTEHTAPPRTPLELELRRLVHTIAAEGGLFVLLYAAYTAYLVLDSAGHDALDGFTTVMLWFVLPLVAATLLATLVFEMRQRQRRRQLAAPSSELDRAHRSP